MIEQYIDYPKKPELPVKIKDNDVVAGWFFKKFIDDYKVYDKRQKEIIRKQKETISELDFIVDKFNAAESSNDSRLGRMLNKEIRETYRLSVELEILKLENEKLKNVNNQLLDENQRLKNKLSRKKNNV